MNDSAPRLVCEGCGFEAPAPPRGPLLFRCPRAEGSAGDHVLVPPSSSAGEWPVGDDPNPFVRYRALTWSYQLARSLGVEEGAYVEQVRRLDRAIAAVDGRGFHVTPILRAPRLDTPTSRVWIKDETGQVSGSHKGRHLFGVLLALEVLRLAGLAPGHPPLAIASCGNAALAAAVLARAAERRLQVFVPEDAEGSVLARLRDLGAEVAICPRPPGSLGDPTLRAFRAAVAEGAIPFACQGTECGLTLDGGKTLAYELVDQAALFDRVFVQVGGGALASSLFRGLRDADLRGRLGRWPRVMAVQSEAVHPLAEGYGRLLRALSAGEPEALPEGPSDGLADALRRPDRGARMEAILRDVTARRRDHLPPWPTPRPCVAHGILDDETYDALALFRGLLATGGSPVVVPEALLVEAEALGRRASGIDADATGTAGLGGLLAWPRPPASERTLLLFTGARRAPGGAAASPA